MVSEALPTIVKAYELNGNYYLRGQEGSQHGEVICCSDNRIVGYIGDNNSGGNPRSQKVLLGLNFPEQGRIAFVKLSPFDPLLMPVAWLMNARDKRKPLAKDYTGIWAAAPFVPTYSQLGLKERLLPSLNNLRRIPLERITRQYLSPENIEELTELSATTSQEGRISLTEK